MTKLKGACIIGQSGGPSSAVNASVLGAIRAALAEDCITTVLGASYGIKGVLKDQLFVMNEEDPNELELLKYTPSAVLGSCRYKLEDPDMNSDDFKRILEIFKKYNVRYFFYNGGNDSMDTCNKIAKYMLKNNYDCRIMGIPKTIDNDLYGTDHCPGYGSAAKFIATSTMEIYLDAHVYDTGMVTILEIMGRNAGWLAAASALAGIKGYAPDLIYLPEIAFDLEKALQDINDIYQREKKVLMVVSEGIKDSKGKYIAEYGSNLVTSADSFGHVQLGGVAAVMTNFIKNRLQIPKVRAIEFSLLQRCAAHLASKTDIDEAYMAGEAAVLNAIQGVTGKMVGFKRVVQDGVYSCEIDLLDLEKVANHEKKIPLEWINEEGNGILQPFIEYALPLIQGHPEHSYLEGLPRFAKLKKVQVCDQKQ